MAASPKVALVTGAGTGIGKAVALALMKEGYATVARRTPRRQAGRNGREGKSTGAKSLAVPTDVGDPAAMQGAVRARRRRPSAASTCCSTMPASARRRCRSRTCPYEHWKQVVDTNLTGMFLCTQEAIRIMKAQDPRGGRIINNGSISAHAPRPHSVAYTATKHAITGLTKSTSLDGRKYDIACSQIDIGNAATAADRAHGQGGRAAGRRQDGGRAAHGRRRTSAAPWSTWPTCRSTPTCCS